MAQIGNQDNARLNGEWGKHVCKSEKKLGNKKRRKRDANVIKEQLLDTGTVKKSTKRS